MGWILVDEEPNEYGIAWTVIKDEDTGKIISATAGKGFSNYQREMKNLRIMAASKDMYDLLLLAGRGGCGACIDDPNWKGEHSEFCRRVDDVLAKANESQ